LDFSGDPIVKFLHYKEQRIAYVELRCKEELQKLLQLNGVVMFYGIQLKLAAWNLQPECALQVVLKLPNHWLEPGLATFLSQSMTRFGALLFPGDPILRCQYLHNNKGAGAYVELCSKEEWKNLLLLNDVLQLCGTPIKIKPWDSLNKEDHGRICDNNDYQSPTLTVHLATSPPRTTPTLSN
jgi:hypothetical protein